MWTDSIRAGQGNGKIFLAVKCIITIGSILRNWDLNYEDAFVIEESVIISHGAEVLLKCSFYERSYTNENFQKTCCFPFDSCHAGWYGAAG